MYSEIAIGESPDGENYYLTEKQISALKLLKDATTLFTGYGGSARCFVPGTYVKTIDGYVPIEKIKIGDFVLSYNKVNDCLEYKKVLNIYSYNLRGTTKMINFGNKIISTNEHKFLFNGKWTKSSELKRRALETSRGQLLYFYIRAISYIKSQKFWKIKINETCQRWFWLFKNSNFNKRKKQYDKGSSFSWTSIYSKSEKFRDYKSQKFRQIRQSCEKFGVDEFIRKQSTRLCKWKTWTFIQERRKATPELFKAWFRQWYCTFERITSNGNKGKVQTEDLHKGKVGKRIWSYCFGDKRRSIEEVLEAREISLYEILTSKEQYWHGMVYDLEVKDNHSYCVTEENIIAHNSGKSLLECFWITFECLAYPGVAYALARRELTVLKRTVLATLFNVFSTYRLQKDKDYKYFEQKNFIKFNNGSEIYLIDMAYQPSDPLYTRFGGLELTGAAVDESNESDIDAIGTLFTRCGWRKNEEYGIKKKMLETFNPDHGHVYKRYYAPYRDDEESDFRKFIPALPSDNPHPATKAWIEDIIKENDKVRIQRLIYGNFDYDDNPDSLVDYDAINDLFANDKVTPGRTKYISTDLAMSGRDRFVAVYWKGNVAHFTIDKTKATGRMIEKDLKKLIQSKGVYNSNVVSDADGLGNYLESYIKNIKPFRGNKRAVKSRLYDNIKSECAWKLAEMINKREIKIICTEKQEEAIKQELSVCLKRDNTDLDDQKKKLIKKPQMKRELGHSPDYFDVLLMKMVFHLRSFSGNKLKVKVNK